MGYLFDTSYRFLNQNLNITKKISAEKSFDKSDDWASMIEIKGKTLMKSYILPCLRKYHLSQATKYWIQEDQCKQLYYVNITPV